MLHNTLIALHAAAGVVCFVTLNQLRAELEHTRSDNRATVDDLDKTITHTAHALADLDNAISRIHRRLRPPGSTGSAS
jgi:hypothetical protein